MTVKGGVAAGYEPVRDASEQVVAAPVGRGFVGGCADRVGTRPCESDSIVMTYFVATVFTAVCALVLVDRGRLDLGAQVRPTGRSCGLRPRCANCCPTRSGCWP